MSLSTLKEFAENELQLLQKTDDPGSCYLGAMQEILPQLMDAIDQHDEIINDFAGLELLLSRIRRIVKRKPLTAIQPFSEETKEEWTSLEEGDICKGEYRSNRCPSLFFDENDGTYHDIDRRLYQDELSGEVFSGCLGTDESLHEFNRYLTNTGLDRKMSSGARVTMPYYPPVTHDTIPITAFDMAEFDILNSLTDIVIEARQKPIEDPLFTNVDPIRIKSVLPGIITIKRDNSMIAYIGLVDDSNQIHHFSYPIAERTEDDNISDFATCLKAAHASLQSNVIQSVLCEAATMYRSVYEFSPDNIGIDKECMLYNWFFTERVIENSSQEDTFNTLFQRYILGDGRNSLRVLPSINIEVENDGSAEASLATEKDFGAEDADWVVYMMREVTMYALKWHYSAIHDDELVERLKATHIDASEEAKIVPYTEEDPICAFRDNYVQMAKNKLGIE
jgi:hypothetical protein